jgi:phosphoribosylglycinamide formyltransferase-1
MKKKIAVLISGGGTNLQAILDAERYGLAGNRDRCMRMECGACKGHGCLLNARVSLVLSSRRDAGGLERAARAGVPNLVVLRKDFHKILGILIKHEIDYIVLAGFLSLLPEEVVRHYRGRIINTHPALIPLFSGKGFYGMRVHEAVLASGMKVSGATADAGVDTGEIIGQRAVPVLPDDTAETLRDRVLATEHIMLVDVVKTLTGLIAS